MNTYNKKYLIGHRGITSIHSENTLESICYIKKFKNLNNLPFNFGSEFDVMLTKDDKIVCHHDNNLKRMTNIDIDVCNINYDELKNIKIKNKYKIPLLKNILDSFKNLNFLLDIEIKDNFKNDKLNIFINKFSNLICKYDYKNFVIKSFNHNIIDKIKL